ncbi:putative beta-1,3-galactosyltransferase 6 [Capsicum baccatum]|uniref:Beta-1,3-galactosyltransferase 6 n=1 Tax=Capsicum baccatum TaxID=33114 RepID=A0A2G2X593_CAPBA|nr:putative beta-1,3-galactosyltransferase 6 [Capsicum baccatum]
MNMDEIPKNIYSDSNPFASDPTATFTFTTAAVVNFVMVASGGGGVKDVVSSKTVDEQCPEDNDRYVKNCRNGRSPKETRHILHRYANEDVSLGSLFIRLDIEHIDERSLCCETPPGVQNEGDEERSDEEIDLT